MSEPGEEGGAGEEERREERGVDEEGCCARSLYLVHCTLSASASCASKQSVSERASPHPAPALEPGGPRRSLTAVFRLLAAVTSLASHMHVLGTRSRPGRVAVVALWRRRLPAASAPLTRSLALLPPVEHSSTPRRPRPWPPARHRTTPTSARPPHAPPHLVDPRQLDQRHRPSLGMRARHDSLLSPLG